MMLAIYYDRISGDDAGDVASTSAQA